MDIITRDKMVYDALAACSVDLDCAVQLVAARPGFDALLQTSRIPWGAPPRFVLEGPGVESE